LKGKKEVKAKVIKWEQGEISILGEDIDEITAKNVDIHIEQMSDNEWWMGITPKSGERLHVIFKTKRASIKCHTYGDKIGLEY